MAHRSHGVRSHWRTREPVTQPTFLDKYRDVAKMRNDAIDAGDEALVIAMDRLLAQFDDEAKQLRRNMPTQNEIIKTLREGLATIATQRFGLDERLSTGELSLQYVQSEKARLTNSAKDLEITARHSFAEWYNEMSSEAKAKRAEAASQRDPAIRMADEMERARLATSPVDASLLLEQAIDMLDGGQPQRAAFLLSVAQDKGLRVADPFFLPAFVARIENALDDSEPLRKDARALEDELDVASRTFEAARMSALAEAGVPGASAAAKVAAYAAGEKKFAVGDGSNPPNDPSGEDHSASIRQDTFEGRSRAVAHGAS